ncbi:hypothetical protein AB0D66_34105 [Streptomyces sp. NPDC048270]|uniref:hypothetical protein n=1 Tax=Streptomyces sp. NPDC048270 TaxID=3154615 RepID=UPI00340D47EE
MRRTGKCYAEMSGHPDFRSRECELLIGLLASLRHDNPAIDVTNLYLNVGLNPNHFEATPPPKEVAAAAYVDLLAYWANRYGDPDTIAAPAPAPAPDPDPEPAAQSAANNPNAAERLGSEKEEVWGKNRAVIMSAFIECRQVSLTVLRAVIPEGFLAILVDQRENLPGLAQELLDDGLADRDYSLKYLPGKPVSLGMYYQDAPISAELSVEIFAELFGPIWREVVNEMASSSTTGAHTHEAGDRTPSVSAVRRAQGAQHSVRLTGPEPQKADSQQAFPVKSPPRVPTSAADIAEHLTWACEQMLMEPEQFRGENCNVVEGALIKVLHQRGWSDEHISRTLRFGSLAMNAFCEQFHKLAKGGGFQYPHALGAASPATFRELLKSNVLGIESVACEGERFLREKTSADAVPGQSASDSMGTYLVWQRKRLSTINSFNRRSLKSLKIGFQCRMLLLSPKGHESEKRQFPLLLVIGATHPDFYNANELNAYDLDVQEVALYKASRGGEADGEVCVIGAPPELHDLIRGSLRKHVTKKRVTFCESKKGLPPINQKRSWFAFRR